MRFDIITIFPKIFNSYFNESIIWRAQKLRKIKINIIDLRKFSTDRHKKIDDKPYGGGSGPDITARLFATELSKQIGQQIVVDNRPGASGSIGTELIARAAPDGYTIGFGGISTFAINPSVLARLP